MGAKCEKWKVYSGVFSATFCASFLAFRILQHFAPGLAFTQKVKGFRGLFFRGINKTRNWHEVRKVYGECFIFCGVFREKRSKNVKYEKWIAGLTKPDFSSWNSHFNLGGKSKFWKEKFVKIIEYVAILKKKNSNLISLLNFFENFELFFFFFIYLTS